MQLLTARNLTVRYPGSKCLVLPDLSLASGSVVALTGPSGFGKTTFVKRVLGLLPPGCETDGELDLNGRTGWIPQDVGSAFSPFKRMSVQLCDGAQHHLGLAFAEAARLAGLMLEQLGVDPERMNDHPHRWSGGMLQRGLVVMALLAEPAIVLADEPTASLDDEAADKVADLLAAYARRGHGIVLVAHDARLRERLVTQ